MEKEHNIKVKVFGIGGGGCNAVDTMIENRIDDVEYYIADTHICALKTRNCENKICLGDETSKKFAGVAGDAKAGKHWTMEALYEFDILLSDADVVFVVATLGHGTGTGGAPVIAEHAKKLGKLVIAVVTIPFSWEGKKHVNNVQYGIDELLKHCDTVIVISDDDVLKIIGRVTLTEAFRSVNRIIDQTVRAIILSLTNKGLINLDLADIALIIKNQGKATFGFGESIGEEKAIEAANLAITSPIFKADITQVKNLLINIVGSSDMTLKDIDDTVTYIRNQATNCLNVMYSVLIDKNLDDKIQVALITTGNITTK